LFDAALSLFPHPAINNLEDDLIETKGF